MKKTVPRETILSLFYNASNGFVSGAQISAELGISRTAVWKHIRSLRLSGFKIDAIPSRGYRLLQTPDILIPETIQADLNCHVIGSQVRCFDVIDSTNSQACSMADLGAAEGLVVVADRQTAGKGRLGRLWVSPGSVNLYTSILLRPRILPMEAPKLTFLSAVAVCRAIALSTKLRATVKWPNDVLLGGKKVAGLLNEMSSETDQVNYVVLGIGVNLNMAANQFPDDLRSPATSLALTLGREVSRLDFARALIKEIDHLYQIFQEQGDEPILKAWTEQCDMIGQAIKVDCNQQQIEGIMQGLSEDGALLIRMPTGQVETVYAGDVDPVQPKL